MLAVCAFASHTAHAQQTNIALGKSVTFGAPPSYGLTADPEDNKQITDGKFAGASQPKEGEENFSLWQHKAAVGWIFTSPVIITIDLGSVQPISGATYSTAAGISDVIWPHAIYVATSDDNKNWQYAGDLIALSAKNGAPPEKNYNTFRFTTHDMQTKGRYISFGVVSNLYTFVDEIEVYRGDESWLALPDKTRAVSGMDNLIKSTIATTHAKQRLKSDIATIRESIRNAGLPTGTASTLEARLNQLSAAASQMQPVSEGFQTILPLNDVHRDILAVHGEMLAAQKAKPLTVWKQNRYEWLPLFAKPQTKQKTELNFSMLGNQSRSDVLMLTNSSGQSQQATLQLKTAPQGATADWLKVYAVAWTDTKSGVPVADALLPISLRNGNYSVEIPAGMTRKVWFTVDSSKLPPARTGSTLVVNGGGKSVAVPFHLDVSKVAMKKPRLSLGMWDYTNGNGTDGINPQNRQAAIELMRSHHVDSPWATGAALPRPGENDFDEENNLKAKLDFSNFDQWVAMWPGARRYFVFPAVGDSFAGAKMGTPEFNARVGSWVKTLSSHMKELGLQPSQLGLLLVDEPHTDEQDAILVAWAKAVNAAAPELTLFEDPTWQRPDQTKTPAAFTAVDILCVETDNYIKGGAPVQAFYQQLRAQGKELWFYSASGPTRFFDPQRYYRHPAWQAFAAGAHGQGFWAFGDSGGAPTSWNAYNETRVGYAPAFLGKDSVNNSVHWESVREGVEDYEVLSMLQDAINASKNAVWKKQAQRVLDGAVKAVTASWSGDYDWTKATDSDLADAQLQKLRDFLNTQKM